SLTAGNYTVTPSKSGYSFEPTDRSYSPLNSNQDNQNFTGTASPQPDVDVKPDIVISFGSVAAGSSQVIPSTFSVENTGNITQKYRLQLTGVPAGWSVKESPGAPTGYDQIKILALFTTSNPPAISDFTDDVPTISGGDIVRASTYDVATSSSFAILLEDESVKGYNCTVGSIRYLWFRFDAPQFTDIITEQFITVTVTAIQE
ncbi:MAG: hypothetical protein QME68_07460, partial [Elusimicrobiota bacterium]|nr:hypothetical protein [Elusimicrobiota bacterium]